LSSGELTLFSYEVMGLVGRDGAGPHDLLQMARRGRMLDWAGESQYYVEPKRLARLGYLEPRTAPGRTRPRTVYSLTDKGLEALRAWAATPVTFTPLKSEALLRLLIADLVGAETTRAALATLRDDLDDLRRRLDDSAAAAAEIPHRERPLLLVNGFLRRLVDLHEELVDEAERELR
jgi:DNA-binding PadR family transcriptional regulator